jgi:hypothetical protein
MWPVRVTTVAMEMQHCVPCIVEVHVTANNTTILSVTKNILITNYVAGTNNKGYLDFHVKSPIVLSDVNKFWSFSTDFYKSPQHRISRKSIQCGKVLIRGDGQTEADGHDEANKQQLLASMRTRLKTVAYVPRVSATLFIIRYNGSYSL